MIHTLSSSLHHYPSVSCSSSSSSPALLPLLPLAAPPPPPPPGTCFFFFFFSFSSSFSCSVSNCVLLPLPLFVLEAGERVGRADKSRLVSLDAGVSFGGVWLDAATVPSDSMRSDAWSHATTTGLPIDASAGRLVSLTLAVIFCTPLNAAFCSDLSRSRGYYSQPYRSLSCFLRALYSPIEKTLHILLAKVVLSANLPEHL